MRKPRGPRPALIQLTARQRAMLEEMAAGRRRPHDEGQRAASIFQSADGARTRHLAEAFGVSDPTVRLWRARWTDATSPRAAAEAETDAATLGGLIPQGWHDAPRRGRPATCTPEQLGQSVAVAGEAPADSGRPVTHWTPRELAEAVIPRGMVPRMSPRRSGRFLKRSGLETAAVTLWAQSHPSGGPGAM
jgi:Homeodomain-like domain-containing protein